ncbi:DNA-binding response regulator, OmpR family, contains REC and winged-helix (wHTH) domain [Modicisalibacter ilicicola DSM 19980]|uniref:DNA-binding response regulator, OmpR family, contains REC and winged-helix (WHTH) domain n=1 Tax=Modicisalibacter ilicicola DSM 19980 TaxID=1121942 RepID=A0A1M5CW40_9GAMM|nr:response regulator transcription factor [Halomonas ilicicola]SHF59000.1 DNA-binding response regulator, OmpR family, contains REC and winged-helix (wHTH) domain [Halomonas ilicicola DSM 19980]
MRILVVEDDAEVARGLRRDLNAAGFAVDLADNALDAGHLGSEEPYDLIVLDLGLPDGSGLELLRRWRDADNPVPVLVLTARDAWHERVEGFRAGADDYVGKPFHPEELIARVTALVRRAQGVPGGVLRRGELTLDEERQRLHLADDSVVELTGTEFRLMRYFMLHAGQILSKTRLAEHIYDYDHDPDSNVVEVYINRLRHKLGSRYIRTRRGQGYLFDGAGRGDDER